MVYSDISFRCSLGIYDRLISTRFVKIEVDIPEAESLSWAYLVEMYPNLQVNISRSPYGESKPFGLAQNDG